MTIPKCAIPQLKLTVTHSGTDYDFSESYSEFELTLRENAVNSTKITLDDYQSTNFIGKCDIKDNLKIEFRYYDKTSTYRQLFGGWITDIQLNRAPEEKLIVTALGYEQALVNMLVQQQYGSQSSNSSLNTIKEILTDATSGVIPKYVEKLLASATTTGYTINTTKIADLTSDYRYLYWTGKPASKCLEDLIQLLSAANAPNAGAHWTAAYSGTTCYLCVGTVANHENPPSDVWPTYWNSTSANSTIAVNEDMITSGFSKKRSDGNYIYLVGDFRRPSDADKWTENNAAQWTSVFSTSTISNENSVYKIGSYSIKGNIATAAQSDIIYYPSTGMNLDFTKIGTQTIIPHLGFWIRVNQNTWRGGIDHDGPSILCGTGSPASNYYNFPLQGYIANLIPNYDTWFHVSIPAGPYARLDETSTQEWSAVGSPNWNDIDWFGLLWYANGTNAAIYLDGFAVHGRIIRAAYDSGKFTSQQCKMKFMRDNVPKDDSLVASDDSGEMAQYAKAELYRAMQTPILGQLAIPMQETMMPGQLAHIHFGLKSDGTYRVDKDMRITELTHRITKAQGALTTLNLTDDVTNSVAVGLVDAYRAIVQATEPNYRDRATASLVSGDLDTTMTVFAKDYA